MQHRGGSWDVDARPMVVIWEATRACQLACRHCRAKAQRRPLPDELNTEEARQLIEQIAAVEPMIFVITGGDPLERRDLWEQVHYAVGSGLTTFLAPSATDLLTQEAILLAQSAGVAGIQLSLDGASATTHDRFRGVRGTFARTMDAARWAGQAGVSLSVATTVTRDNADELPEIAERVREMGARMWSLFFLVPTGRGRPEWEVDPRRAEEILHWLVETGPSLPFRVKTTEAPQIRRMAAVGQVGTRIGDGAGFVFIAYNGEVYPSGFLPLSVGNVRSDSLGDIYRTAPLMKELRDPDALHGPRCGRCPDRALCGGSRSRAWAHSGDPLGDDPLCFVGEGVAFE